MSTRFGRNKLLEMVHGETIIERVVKNSIASNADEVIVVLGHQSRNVRRVLEDHKCKLIINKNYHKGQCSSVKKGVEELMDRAEAIMILPGDVALISSRVIDAVIREYLSSSDAIVVASHHGSPGHPILFSKELFPEVLNIDESTFGLKSVVNRHMNQVKRVEVGSPEVLIDIDTQEDFKHHLVEKDLFNQEKQ